MKPKEVIYMYCSNCGNKIDGNDKFCSSCGNEILITNTETATIISSDRNNDIDCKIAEENTNSDEYYVVEEKIKFILFNIKELVINHKLLFGIFVLCSVIICYSLFWTSTVNEAANLASQGEYVKAKAKVSGLLDPFHNKEIEKIKYFGKVMEPREKIKVLEQNPNPHSETYYSSILQNLFEGKRLIEKTTPPENVEMPEVLYTYYFLELTDYVKDVYKLDVSRLCDLSENELTKHITQIAKNIVSQNIIDEENLQIAERSQKHDVKIYPLFSYDENKWVCSLSLKIGENSRHKYYDKIRISITYYDDNYKVIQSDSCVVEDAYRGKYIKDIEIVTIPKIKGEPFKYQINHDLY